MEPFRSDCAGEGSQRPRIRERMNASRTGWAWAALATAALGMGCAAGSAGPSATGTLSQADATAMAELEELYWARLDSAATRYTQADVHFMSGMIGHHAQAVVMAELAPERAASPSIRTLAARIIRAQEDEIAIMEQWLRERGEAVPQVHVHGTRLTIHDSHHDTPMPGMLTPQQMSRLEEASGTEFDRLFLTYMIEHHRGAITMVRELFDTVGAAQDPTVFKFASDIQVDQATEVARMERMLTELTSGGGLR